MLTGWRHTVFPAIPFRRLFTNLSLKNTGIKHPVLVDVVSGEIKPVSWKQGTTDTLEALPLKDSIMVVTDENYFDWPVLPEAPSSLNVNSTGGAMTLKWQGHGGNPTGFVVERRIEVTKEKRGTWNKIASLPAGAAEYRDTRSRTDNMLRIGFEPSTRKASPRIRISFGCPSEGVI